MTVEEKLKMQLQDNQTRKPRRQRERPQNSYLMQPKEVPVLVEASWCYSGVKHYYSA